MLKESDATSDDKNGSNSSEEMVAQVEDPPVGPEVPSKSVIAEVREKILAVAEKQDDLSRSCLSSIGGKSGDSSVHLDIRQISHYQKCFQKKIQRSLNKIMRHLGFIEPRVLIINVHAFDHYEFWLGNVVDARSFVRDLQLRLQQELRAYIIRRHRRRRAEIFNGEFILHVVVSKDNVHHLFCLIVNF